MRAALVLATAVLILAGPARAYDFPPLEPMNEKDVDPSMMADVFGTWELRGAKGKKRCRVTLLKEMGIGGRQLEAAPGCDKTFPVMGDITAWRLNESWTIDLVDALRKVRIRLQTPDERYIAVGEDKDVAGIDEFIKVEIKPQRKK